MSVQSRIYFRETRGRTGRALASVHYVTHKNSNSTITKIMGIEINGKQRENHTDNIKHWSCIFACESLHLALWESFCFAPADDCLDDTGLHTYTKAERLYDCSGINLAKLEKILKIKP